MRIALAPFNPIVGAVAQNAEGIGRAIVAAREGGAKIVVFPELALCGYPPKDLLFQDGFIEACASAAEAIGRDHTQGVAVVFGLPTRAGPETRHGPGAVHNSLILFENGRPMGFYHKRLLPTYDVFDEDRYFVPGKSQGVVILAGLRVGFAICEDLWKGEDAGFAEHYRDVGDPVADLMRDGAQIVISPSASPFILGKGDKHRRILQAHARRHRVPVASVNQFGGNDELVFDGHCIVFDPVGALVADGPEFTGQMTLCHVPLASGLGPDPRAAPPVQHESPHTPRPPGSAPTLRAHPQAAEQELFWALTLGIRDYLRKTGFKKAIIGLSGGIDSALTAVLAAAAIGPANVTGVAMPSKYSSTHSVDDAADLAGRIGMQCFTAPIEDGVRAGAAVADGIFAAMNQPLLGAKLPDIAEENLQSRVRGTLLMTLSNRTGAMVLTTGNKSELAVGYCTLYGDMNGGLAVLSDVSKQWVYRLARWINAHHAACGFLSPPIPESSITKAPSAELRPDQKDQDSLPPYEVLDEIIERCVEGRQSVASIIAQTGFDADTVRRVRRLIDLSEYKRKQAAIGLKVTSVAFGSGRRWPIAQGWREM